MIIDSGLFFGPPCI